MLCWQYASQLGKQVLTCTKQLTSNTLRNIQYSINVCGCCARSYNVDRVELHLVCSSSSSSSSSSVLPTAYCACNSFHFQYIYTPCIWTFMCMYEDIIMMYTNTKTHQHSHDSYNSWIDSYMDELPSSESPESSQPEPETEVVLHPAVADSEPPEPYIMFEKPKPGVIHSPPHQPAESGTRSPPDNSQSKGTPPNEDDEAKRDSYYSDRYV